MKKLLIVCGPTATGKTSLSLKLAKKFNGQIISADSRQVYKGMDIGTGKDLPKNAVQKKDGHYLLNNIKLWGYDLVTPDQDFSLAHFSKFARPLIKKIQSQNQLPILVGGTGLYLKAITNQIKTLNIPPNPTLRLKLEKLSTQKLVEKLKQLNLSKYNSMNHSDQLNPRRLIRAIEIHSSKNSKKVSPKRTDLFETNNLWIGLKASKDIMDRRIEARVKKRLKAGAQKEVKTLLEDGYSFDLPSMSAMGYQQWQPFFNQQSNLDKVRLSWEKAEKQYLRRQLTWFNKNKKINWFDVTVNNYYLEVVRKITPWYTK